MIAPGDTLRVQWMMTNGQDIDAGRVVLALQDCNGACHNIDVSLTDLLFWTRAAFLHARTEHENRAFAAADAVQRQHDAAYIAHAEALFAKLEKTAADVSSNRGSS